MAVGAQLTQPPVVLINTANAITQKNFDDRIWDSIFRPSPTWWALTKMGVKKTGGALVWPLGFLEETAGGAYYGLQNFDTSTSDSIQAAQAEWKFYYQNITIPGTDLMLNDGPEQVVSLITAKIKMAGGSLLQKINRAVYGVSPQNTSIDFDSLPSALASSGTYAGITIISTFWLSNGLNGPAAGGAVSLANMMTDYTNACQGNEEPDRIFTTFTGYASYWNLLLQQQRQISDDETTRAGFKMHLMFNNATVMRDYFVPAGEMEMLTAKYVEPVFHPGRYFKVMPWVVPTNQDGIFSKVLLAGNVQYKTLRQHSRRTGITNA